MQKADAARVTAFFQERGITNAEISAINIQRLRSSGNDDNSKTVGYRLRQTLRLESADVARVMELQQQSSSLVAAGVELEGAADHGVSEALYLRDPDQNGVELYWDRPKETWPQNPDGSLAMYTRALDLAGLLAEK